MMEGRDCLQGFFREAKMSKDVILPSVKMLHTVVENLLKNPMDPKYRSLNSTKKPVQEKLLQFESIGEFLVLMGFEPGEE